MRVNGYRLIVLVWAAVFVAMAWFGPERTCAPTAATLSSWGVWAALLSAAFALRHEGSLRSLSVTAHLRPRERALVRGLWTVGGVALVFVLVTDAQAGVVPCPRPLSRDIALWAAMATLMVGLFIAGEPPLSATLSR